MHIHKHIYRNNFVIASLDVEDPIRGLVKRCTIIETAVLDDPQGEGI
jgi:hypothetical protein